MYLGRIVEIGGADAVCRTPLHPYTRALLDSIPEPDPAMASGTTYGIPRGDPPDLRHQPAQPQCLQLEALGGLSFPDSRTLGASWRSKRAALSRTPCCTMAM
jgi:oligopeptide/dipeptide ABC transporter ATP-binding protein